jgi:hypothetical protein
LARPATELTSTILVGRVDYNSAIVTQLWRALKRASLGCPGV